MPVMDGIEAAKLILESQAWLVQHGFDLPRVKIATVSAYTDELTRQRCIDAGITEYLTKPINAEELKTFFESVYGQVFKPLFESE